MPVVLEFVVILPSFNFRTIPVWVINYMVTLAKSGFLKLDTVYICGQIILSWGAAGYLSYALYDI